MTATQTSTVIIATVFVEFAVAVPTTKHYYYIAKWLGVALAVCMIVFPSAPSRVTVDMLHISFNNMLEPDFAHLEN